MAGGVRWQKILNFLPPPPPSTSLTTDLRFAVDSFETYMLCNHGANSKRNTPKELQAEQKTDQVEKVYEYQTTSLPTLLLCLLLMAFWAQRLKIGFIIRSTLCNIDDMVQFKFSGYSTTALAGPSITQMNLVLESSPWSTTSTSAPVLLWSWLLRCYSLKSGL